MLRSLARPPATAPPLPPPAPEPSPPTLPTIRVPVPARGAPGAWRWLGLAASVLILLAVVFWLFPRGTESPTTSPTTLPPATTAPAAATTPTASGPAPAPAAALPAGWHVHRDPTGFSVAVPDGWTIERRGTIVYFHEPNGSRLLGIDQTNQPQPDPVADWAGKEKYRVARGDFPSYQRVRLEAVNYFIKAADWEFTYVRDGVRLHINNRGFITSPTQAYGMWWSTPDSQWAASAPALALIQRTFTPAA